MPNVHFSFRRGAGDVPEILYGKVEIKPTLAFARGSSLVLPAPTTLDLVNGEATANNVYPTPAPVAGQVEWAYRVKAIDTRGQSFEWMVGVPDSTGTVEFTSLPRYFETKPPLFGKGDKGDPGEAAKITVGTVTGGVTASVTNSGTNQNAVLDFVLPKGDKGDRGDGVPAGGSALQYIRKDASGAATEWATLDKTAVGLNNVDNTSDSNKPVSAAQATAIGQATTVAANTKLASDPPSSWKEGVTVTNCRVSDGWPVVPGGHASFTRVTTHRARNLTPAIQYASAYVTNPDSAINGNNSSNAILYRTGNSADVWGDWQQLLTKQEASKLYATMAQAKELYRSQPVISQEQKMYGSLKYNLITIHAGGQRRPGLIHKFLNGVNTGVSPTEAKEHYIDTAVKLSGGTIVNNASGLIHISGVPSEDGARVRLRGAQVLNGVAINNFPTDTHWTCHEAVGIMPDGELRGFSKLRGDSAASMVSAGVENSFTFGPILVEGGVARDLSDPFWAEAVTIVSSLNFIGQKDNGDVVLINSPGKSGTSGGTLADQTQIALNEGLVFAFSLDRGGSGQCWAGASPLCASSDAGGRRLIADYLYTTAPIGTTVIAQEIPLVLSSTVKAVPGYEPSISISHSGRVQIKGRINRSDDLNFGSEITTVALIPTFGRNKDNVSGICTGMGDAQRRWLQNGNDGYLRILGASAAAPTTTYLDLSMVNWQIG